MGEIREAGAPRPIFEASGQSFQCITDRPREPSAARSGLFFNNVAAWLRFRDADVVLFRSRPKTLLQAVGLVW